ncbi:uncharacterized protein LOC141632032 [Silene latifolia]|uniref:uncharacterized protein LOC141632032 n=1 Tax=Silene latifolia TaxID=37657 RepID=UPI003D780589
MSNDEWLDQFPEVIPMFHPEGMFDHCPCTINLVAGVDRRKGSFKYFNMWGKDPQFLELVQEVWDKPLYGIKMFHVVKRLKMLKHPLKGLNGTAFANIETSAKIAKHHLYVVQEKLHADPLNLLIQQEVNEASNCYRDLENARRSFLAQKAKAHWMQEGDDNTSYFHSIIKARRMSNKILTIQDMAGHHCNTIPEIEEAFIAYYKALLGSSKPVRKIHVPVVRNGKVVSNEQGEEMVRDVTIEEIQIALKSIPANKSPGPDGYTSQFFKDASVIIEKGIIEAVQEFFISGQLLRQVNSTTLTLIPKKTRPVTVTNFRPIACCNVLYKIISKVLCNRLAKVLPSIISESQSAFIQGRDIVDNILICHDLVRLYKRRTCSPRSIMKIDLKKAYDSVEWSFIEQMLHALKFPERMITWIMTCVTTPSYTIALNGSSFGYFPGKRGIREGDPLSPLLFTICMDYLSRVLEEVTSRVEFNYHPLCRPLKLTHLCFADDLLMFSRGDRTSIKVLLRAFASFSCSSGLEMNTEKSDIYFNGMEQGEIDYILRISGFKPGVFPFRYLGVPIYHKRMGIVIDRIEGICRNYLWSGSDQYGKTPTVNWANICKDKKHGGLGIVNSRIWKTTMIGKYTSWLAMKSDHLWLRWVCHVYMKGRDWFDYKPSVNTSWTWRKICQVKDIMKDGFATETWAVLPGSYLVSNGYKWLMGQQHHVTWYPLIWNKTMLPRHAFIGWLIVQGRLMTRDRLFKFGITTDMVCAICSSHNETHQHLFSDCTYSTLCWDLLNGWLGLSIPKTRVVDWFITWRCPLLMKKQIIGAAIVALWYHIWTARNIARIEARVLAPRYILRQVKQDIQGRCQERKWTLKMTKLLWEPVYV